MDRAGADTDTAEKELDFRSPVDDAWYGVRLSLDGGTLAIHHTDLAEPYVDHFRAADFRSLAAVDEFRDRFRPLSVQLQDRDCRRVVEVGAVCACDFFGDNDVRFYDADVEMACYRAHQVSDGRDEVCKCGFLVVWRHGPKLGRKSWTCVENLCLIQEEKVACSAVLHHFFRIAVQIIERNSKFDGIGIKDTKGTQQNQAHDKDIIGSEILEEQLTADVDMGGGYLGSKIIKQQENYPFIMIDYLEKDLPSSEIIDFLYQHTSISCKVYVVPCFPPESCARAIIYMKDHGETEKLWQFLNSPHQLIVSSRGRPWIIHYLWRPEVHGQTHSGSTFTFEGSPGKKRKVSQSITTVHEGSEEYEKGKRLKKLFMMFHEHFQSLHKRLTMEEKRL